MNSEYQRLQTIQAAQGISAMLAFAQRTYRVYRLCLMQSRKRGWTKPHHASLPEYRSSFIQSCGVFRKVLGKGCICSDT